MLEPYNRRRRAPTLLERYGQQLGQLTERQHLEAARQVAQDILERRVKEKTAELMGGLQLPPGFNLPI